MKVSMRFLLPILLLTLTAACNQTRASSDNPTPQISVTSAQLTQNPTQPKNIVRTEALSPTPIRINLKNLPAPFATESASKRPEVVPIPQNPMLRVPRGFTVNVFAEGLDAPRWLALTPSGDVLVTETGQNRIRLLRDSNGDGVAEVRETFASRDNGLNRPFWYGFCR
jgi:glucose/arabinose dehydrogenase